MANDNLNITVLNEPLQRDLQNTVNDDLNIMVLNDPLHRDIKNTGFEIVVDNDDSNAALDDDKITNFFKQNNLYN
jgi:hypothetical protein